MAGNSLQNRYDTNEIKLLDPCSTHTPISFMFDLGCNTILNKTDDNSPVRLVSELFKSEILSEMERRRVDVQFITYSSGIYIEENWGAFSLYDIDAPINTQSNYTKELKCISAAISYAVKSARNMRMTYNAKGIQAFKPQIYLVTSDERTNSDLQIQPIDELCEETLKSNKVKLHIMHLGTKIKMFNIPYVDEYAIDNETWTSTLISFIISKLYARPILGIEEDISDTMEVMPI